MKILKTSSKHCFQEEKEFLDVENVKELEGKMRGYQKIVSGIFSGLVKAWFAVATRVNPLMPHYD